MESINICLNHFVAHAKPLRIFSLSYMLNVSSLSWESDRVASSNENIISNGKLGKPLGIKIDWKLSFIEIHFWIFEKANQILMALAPISFFYKNRSKKWNNESIHTFTILSIAVLIWFLCSRCLKHSINWVINYIQERALIIHSFVL